MVKRRGGRKRKLDVERTPSGAIRRAKGPKQKPPEEAPPATVMEAAFLEAAGRYQMLHKLASDIPAVRTMFHTYGFRHLWRTTTVPPTRLEEYAADYARARQALRAAGERVARITDRVILQAYAPAERELAAVRCGLIALLEHFRAEPAETEDEPGTAIP